MTTTTTPPASDKRIPSVLAKNPIFKEFCLKYLSSLDEIAEYNKAVLAEKDSEWNAGKVLEKARSFARPTEKGVEVNKDILAALEAYEESLNAQARARKTILDMTAKELGITLSATADRNPEIEGPLKENRKNALTIGQQLSLIAGMTSDENTSSAVTSFLSEYELPVIGRNQTTSFGTDGGSTPKYRVSVVVKKGEETLLEADGFTKTAIALSQPKFGYERGKAPKADSLRGAWENAGNTPSEPGKVSPVTFSDNGLEFILTKK